MVMVTAKETLLKARVTAGMTIRDLSKRSGAPIATISRAENGKPLSTKSAHKLCEAFDLGFDDLFVIQADSKTNNRKEQ